MSSDLISIYIVFVGGLILSIGLIELLFPGKAFLFWKWWISKKIFFLHGIILILGGFPLTIYNGRFSTFIFVIGIAVVFSGPFILLYPEKIRNSFMQMYEDAGLDYGKKIMYFDSMLRITTGALFIVSYFI